MSPTGIIVLILLLILIFGLPTAGWVTYGANAPSALVVVLIVVVLVLLLTGRL